MIESKLRLTPQDQDRKELLYTNQVILQVDKNGDLTYYLPCYVRFLIKQLQNVSTQEMSALLSGTLYFSFYYGNMDRQIVDEFIGNNKAILLEFNKEDPISLREGMGITMQENIQEKTINFSVRQRFRAKLEGSLFFAPFQLLDIYIGVAVRSVQLIRQKESSSNTTIKFNCMDSPETEILIQGQEIGANYHQIASYYLQTKHNNSWKIPFKPFAYFGNNQFLDSEYKPSIDDNVEEDQINFQYAHFRIPIYQLPAAGVLTIFLPLWLNGLIGLVMFFQETSLGMRLGTIAVLMFGMTFVHAINSSVPRSSKVRLIDILVFLHLIGLILLLAQSFDIRKEDFYTYDFKWQQNRLFIASIIINLISFTVVILLFLADKCIWMKKYKRVKSNMKKKIRFSREGWKNQQCNLVFRALTSHKLKNV